MLKRLFIIVLILAMSIFAVRESLASSIIIEDVSGIFSPKIPDAGAVFMKIRNKGTEDDFLIDSRVNIKGVRTELHDVKDGRMFQIERIPIPAKSSVELKRGSLHVMLFGLPLEIKEGDEIIVTLIFEKAGEKVVKFNIKSSRKDIVK